MSMEKMYKMSIFEERLLYASFGIDMDVILYNLEKGATPLNEKTQYKKVLLIVNVDVIISK